MFPVPLLQVLVLELKLLLLYTLKTISHHIDMEAKLVVQTKSPFATLLAPTIPTHHHHKPRWSRPIIVSVLARPPTDNVATHHKTLYNDNWFDRIAINHLSQSVQAATGKRNSKSGYGSLVEAATAVSRSFSPSQQRELVIQALDKAFPRPFLSLIRTLLPQSKFTRELFAVFTTVFFAWLVGPCQVRESELNGKTEKNVVHIKKCRFLEETNCVGLCTNLCKTPSQIFIKDSFGMPVNMVPNFDDMSCEMIFGQEPPASSDDPAFKQPCYKLCKEKQKHSVKCST